MPPINLAWTSKILKGVINFTNCGIICKLRCCKLFGLNLHVNGLENLFLCLKIFAINVFNANDFLLLEQKEINILGKKSKKWLPHILI